jgi:hypothetical protein
MLAQILLHLLLRLAILFIAFVSIKLQVAFPHGKAIYNIFYSVLFAPL